MEGEEEGMAEEQTAGPVTKKRKAIEEQEEAIERDMKEYFDQLEEEDARVGLGLTEMAIEGDEDDNLEGAEEDEIDGQMSEDEEEGVIRAANGATFDSDDISDAEYEKLLKEDMDEEEYEKFKKQEQQGKAGEGDEEEDDEADDALDDEIENNIFSEMRKEQADVIKEQEQKLLSDKPWTMKGEIRGHERPKDALVDVNVEFQHGVELKAKSTAKVSKEIENMIQQRILKEAFDDPKEIVINQDLSWKQNFEDLNFEKDQRGLAAIYEEQYKKNMLGLPVESKEQKVHNEILLLFREINNNLDNLTNSSYIPMPLVSEIKKGKNDIETINLEEKIPITIKTSDTVLPKQLFETNHRNFMVDAEKTHIDNKRDRMIAKRKIRTKIKEKRSKELVKTLDFKGQTKYEYNMVNKTSKAIDREHENAGQPRTNLTKSSDFFKVMQSNKETRKSSKPESKPQHVQAANLKKLKL